MKWFIDLSVRAKLLSAFGTIAVVAAVIGWFGYSTSSGILTHMNGIYDDRLIPIRDLGYANAALLVARGDTRNAMSTTDPSERKRYLDIALSQSAVVDRLIEKYSATTLVQEEKDTLKLFLANWNSYKQSRDRAFDHALAMRTPQALEILDGDARKSLTAARKNLRSLIDINARVADVMRDESVADASDGINSIILLLIFGIAVSAGLGIFIAKIIADPLNMVVTNIENADLNSRFNSDRKDEIGGLQRSFDGFVSSIKSTLVQVSEASAAVASASTEISSSTEELAAGSQEQSTQAAEVAGAVEEMTRTIIENSRNASDTAETARKARETAAAGGKVVERTVAGMREIAEVVNTSAATVKELGHSSDQIGEIISTIEDIADQTNLLALNAAIEAARAGDQGRGFAVVADEVRKLAERTSKATKEIAGMIKKIQTDTVQAVEAIERGTVKMNDGIALADQAGVSLKEIMEISQAVTDKVTQIAAASEEQSSASEQISKNVEGISAVTHQSASGTQQIARTAEDLNRLTENLQQVLEQFKIEPDARQRPAAMTPKSRKAVNSSGRIVEAV